MEVAEGIELVAQRREHLADLLMPLVQHRGLLRDAGGHLQELALVNVTQTVFGLLAQHLFLRLHCRLPELDLKGGGRERKGMRANRGR